ncbi:MAG: DNA integrity scanning protein DisA nucleotide-binding domain protein [Planctomycetota bacterium]|nr:DNA integrity scanning protein DisA nucleotide-binding domain protein [Planctomycetota bacterium]
MSSVPLQRMQPPACDSARKSLPFPQLAKKTLRLPTAAAELNASSAMKILKLTDHFQRMIELAGKLADMVKADAMLLLIERPTDWAQLRAIASESKLLLAADTPEQIHGAKEAGFTTVLLSMADSPVYEKLTQALLECVADEVLAPGSRVVALYSGFESGTVDSMSVINLGEHLERLTARDLRQLETNVPLDTLKTVVDLAVDIGREGREGKPVGTLFVVGDSRKVLASSHPTGFDPMRGYPKRERSLSDARVREGVKEIAQMDGAFIVASDGTVEAACRYIDAPATTITLSKGLGSRHWAAAAITRKTKSVAVAVSESNGTVRIFQNGEVVLRIEPFHRPMKWKDFEYEPPE